MPIPELSVLVPTYGRGDTLRQLLDHLAQQSLAKERFEVVVVDDGSPQPLLLATARYPMRVTLLRQDNAGPGAARNLGARHLVVEHRQHLAGSHRITDVRTHFDQALLADRRPDAGLLPRRDVAVGDQALRQLHAFRLRHAHGQGRTRRRRRVLGTGGERTGQGQHRHQRQCGNGYGSTGNSLIHG